MKDERINEDDFTKIRPVISGLIHLSNIFTTASDAMLWEIQRRLKSIDKSYHINQELKRRYRAFSKAVEDATKQYENFILPLITSSDPDPHFEGYEFTRIYAQELIRLLMLYHETCSEVENHSEVFDLLSSFKTRRGIFTSEDINQFKLGCKW